MAIEVDTNIPSGNAGDVSVAEEDGMTIVRFAADPHGGPECLWFCFRIRQTGDGGGAGSKVKLVFQHLDNILGGNDPENVRPVIKYAEGDWNRLQAGAVDELPDGRRSIAWLIEAPGEHVNVAFCYPYGRTELDTLLRETDGYWRCDTIGISQAGRPLLRLSNDYGQVDGERPGLYLIARQHSGETPGSWVLEGFLRHMASVGAKAPLIWAVPLTNIDGVEQGDYGKDNFPYDLNRAWGSPPMRHEALVIQRDMQRWRGRCRAALGLDFHAPGGCESDGMYFYLPDPERHGEHHAAALQWVERFAAALTSTFVSEQAARVVKYRSRWPTPTFSAYCRDVLDICALTVETPYAMAGSTLLTRERYREAGEHLAECVVERLSA